MQRFDEKVSQYIHNHSTPPSDLLQKLERETYAKILRPQMVSGHLQGNILKMISCMIRPMQILELGTFTGYSTLCLAEGLQADGELHSIDINDELEEFTTRHLQESPRYNQIKLYYGDALKIVPAFTQKFDLVFIDADKREYPDYYEMVLECVKPGGFILADDVLWYGKVNEEVPENDTYTRGLIRFNQMVQDDSRVENVILPLRDGIMLIRKL